MKNFFKDRYFLWRFGLVLGLLALWLGGPWRGFQVSRMGQGLSPAALNFPQTSPSGPAAESDAAADTSTREKTLLTFAVVGDSRDGEPLYRKIIEQVNGSGAQFLIHLGDMVAHGYPEEWAAFGKMQTALKIPFYAAPGNHDVYAGRLPYQQEMGRLYYSFNQAGVHFVVLDNARGKIGEEQMSWLSRDLEKNRGKRTFFFMHQPPRSKVSEHTMAGDANQATAAAELLSLAAPSRGVQALFAGHIHGFAEEDLDGVRLIVSGGGGSPIYLPEFLGGFYHWLLVKVYADDWGFEVKRVE